MKWYAQTFEEFGRSIGIPELHPGPDGSLTLKLDFRRRLVFQVIEDAVVMLLAAGLPVGDTSSVKRRALQLCDMRQGRNTVVHAGITRNGELVYSIRISSTRFRPHEVEQAFDLLTHVCEMAFN